MQRMTSRADCLHVSDLLWVWHELRRQATGPDQVAYFEVQDLARLLGQAGTGAPTPLEARVSRMDLAELLIRDAHHTADGRIDVDEWAHITLRQCCGKSVASVVLQLGALLDLVLSTHPEFLDDLHAAYDAAGAPRETGKKALENLAELFGKQLRCHLVPEETEHFAAVRETILEDCCSHSDRQPLDTLIRDPREFAREVSLSVNLSSGTVLEIEAFTVCFLGRRRQEVKLNVYDLSGGRARMLSRWLPMPELEGLWHSGLVVFGWEYFYCGDVICAEPGRTVFGVPNKHISLGWTIRQRSELHQFIVQEIKPRFTRDKYDTLDHNCNHFSDHICGWLGCQRLPDEILQQHEKIFESPFAKAAWPILQPMLGGSVVSMASSKDTSSWRRWHDGTGCHSIVGSSLQA
mmetsp:Transcript_123889/g.246572  ORF Transcript_123889/g.246572 Transcript_123889/m.246572 type:complete len:406 (+) Transcript_123889:78-1295(+)